MLCSKLSKDLDGQFHVATLSDTKLERDVSTRAVNEEKLCAASFV